MPVFLLFTGEETVSPLHFPRASPLQLRIVTIEIVKFVSLCKTLD